VDAERVALLGFSKGAEFALVVAAHYEWVDRVAACSPSSFVWEGAALQGPVPVLAGRSSWSIQGRPLPFIPYDRDLADAAFQGKLSGLTLHERSLEAASKSTLEAARIPVEKIRARMLLLGAGSDQTWPSATMVRRIEDDIRRVDHSNQVTAFVFEGASHGSVFGVGDEMTRINPISYPEPQACARAAAKAWAETKKFLARP
jgi:dienelactone hydrolase